MSNHGFRKHSVEAKGKKGLRTVRKDDFIETYEWQLKEFGDTSHKIVTTLPLHEYYAMGLNCIKEDITIAEFIRTAIRENIGSVKKYAKVIKKKAKNKSSKSQGSLFDGSI